MPPDVTGNFSAAGGVGHMDRVLQIKIFSQRREIVGVCVHVVSVPSLRGTAVASTVSRDDAVAALAEVQHLTVPVVRGERPAVAKDYGLAFSPVSVKNFVGVFFLFCLLLL